MAKPTRAARRFVRRLLELRPAIVCYSELMSQKTVTQRLGLKAGKSLFVALAPGDVAALWGEPPPGASVVEDRAGPFPVVLFFAKDRAAMVQELPACKAKLAAGGAL